MIEEQIIRILADEYDAILVAEPKTGAARWLRFSEENQQVCGSGDLFHSIDDVIDRISPVVHPEDSDLFHSFLQDPGRLLGDRPSCQVTYRSNRDGHYQYFQAKLNRSSEEDGQYLIAFSNVDSSVRTEKENSLELKKQVEAQADIIRREVQRYTAVQKNVIEGMATLVESRDLNTGEHVKHTRHYVSMILRQLRKDGTFPEITPEYEQNVIMASVLHDVGKIFISDFILNKPGKLTPEEFEIIKSHTVLGAEIVDEIFATQIDPEAVSVIRDIVLHHHEKWNGTGYPHKLAGDDIPLAARIMAVSDVFDALVAKRPYKAPMPLDKALGILVKDSGSHFDKRIVDAFIVQRDELEEYMGRQTEGRSISNMFKVFGDFEKKLQNASIINALSKDYDFVFYAEPDNDKIGLINQNPDSRLGRVSPDFPTTITFQTFLDLTRPAIAPEDLSAYIEAVSRDTIRNQFEKGSVSICTIRAIVGGEVTYHELKCVRIGKADDAGFDILMGLRDVTEVEEARRKAQQVLAEAKARAEEANAAKTDFVHRISHDIRTPFTDVIGFTDKALRSMDDPAVVQEAPEKVRRSEETLLSVIDRILQIEGIEADAPADAPAPAEEAEEEIPVSALVGKRVLLVEDNEMNLEIAEMLLTESGAEVTPAENGQLALDTLTAAGPDAFDIVLMDVQMPVMDGLEATRRIRALEDPDLAAIPIIAMTASVFEKDKKATLEAGMNAHLSKPIDLIALLKVVDAYT